MMHFDETGKYVKSIDMHNSKSHVMIDHLSTNSNRICKSKCLQYKATRPTLGNRYANGQVRCQTCEIYLTENGAVNGYCLCCNMRVRSKPRSSLYKEKYNQTIQNKPPAYRNAHDSWIDTNEDYRNIDDENSNEKKSTPVYEEIDESVKTFYEFKDFLDSIKLQANYQLVMLKELIEYGENHKGEIAESLAYFNNKDTTNLNVVKSYFDVPVYDVLLNHGFVITTGYKYRRFPIYKLNVYLNESQKIGVLEIIENKLNEYNQLNEIPENEFPNSDNRGSIVWNSENSFEKFKPIIVEENSEKSKESIRLERESKTKFRWDQVLDDVKQEMKDKSNEKKFTTNPKYKKFKNKRWIWPVTPENWEILKSQNVWGSTFIQSNIAIRMKSGDQVAFYVIGTQDITGIFELVGDWYDSPGKTWNDDLQPDGSLMYVSQIQIKPIQLGSVKIHTLHKKLDVFINSTFHNKKNLIVQGKKWIFINHSKPLSEDDFAIIQTELMRNQDDTPLTPEQSSCTSESMPTFAKTCPKCNVTQVTASLRQEFEEKIEESFGYRQRDPNDPDSKIPQSYCRQCRTSQISSNVETETLSSEDVDTKIFNFDNGELNIQNCKILSSDIIKKDQILDNDAIIKLFKVGNMGGIRYTKYNNVIVLLSTYSDDYDNSTDLPSRLITYTGEGKGDQEIKNGNEKILNSQNTPMVFFKEIYQEPGVRPRGALDNKYKFIGVVKYNKYYWTTEKGRKVIKFILEIVS